MRTQLTLDDDVAGKLKAKARREGRPLREVVNEALRRGLSQRRGTGTRQTFKVSARDLGALRPGISLDNVAEFIEQIESPLHRWSSSIGRHYAGPHWEALDGSKIVATVKARADAPRADAVPWLPLGARSVGQDGVFSKVTSIQRANTVGGIAPKDGCSQATLGAPARIAYTADYYFYSPR